MSPVMAVSMASTFVWACVTEHGALELHAVPLPVGDA